MGEHTKKWVLGIGAVVLGVVSLGAGCSASSDDELTAAAEQEALSRTNAIDRAMQWVNAKLKYCQSPNHERDYDTACSTICSREDNSAWNPYRSDCSGFVSWAWGLPAPGRVTSQFAPYNTAVSHTIPGEALAPGDALNSSDHIIMFKQWTNPGHDAVFMEEPGCSSSMPYAHEFTSSVSISGDQVYVSYEGKTFTSIRYNGISSTSSGGGGGGSTPPPSAKKGCFSDSLNRKVPFNTCVQSVSNGDWYQCDAGSWVNRWTDPAACTAVYPLGTGGECYSHTLGKDVADDTCVQSEYDHRWYQCAGGSWVDRWTDPNECSSVHAL